MELIIPRPELAHAGLRALKTVAVADGCMHALERRLLESVQAHVLHSAFDLDALEPIAAPQLSAAIADAELRERILSACVVMALIDGEASPAEGLLLEQFARALAIASPGLKDLRRVIDQQLWIARIDITRRSFIGQRGRAYLAEHGVRGFGRVVASVLGIENRGLAAFYRALAHTPRGTLGREYFEFVRANKFGLPGEAEAAPEVVVFHDCLHVLGGYGTASLEETQIAAFQAGMLKRDPLFGLLFMLAQFHLGIQMTPVAQPEKLVVDPALMMKAFVRGTRVRRDLSVDWVPQRDFARTLEELRDEYNIEARDVVS